MKKYIIMLLFAPLFLGALARAQGITWQDIPVEASEFNWWAECEQGDNECDLEYDKRWSAYVDHHVIHMNAPWNSPSDHLLSDIFSSKDYLPEDGWELVQFDFGVQKSYYGDSQKQPVGQEFPYFILYNKYRSLMRTFVYLANFSDNCDDCFRYMMKITQSTSNQLPGIYANVGGRGYVPSEEFLETNYTNNFEVDILASKNVGIGDWATFEWNPDYDPFIEDGQYLNSELSFEVYGVQEYAIDLKLESTSNSYSQLSNDFDFDAAHAFMVDGSIPSAVQEETSADGTSKIKSFLESTAKFSKSTKLAGISSNLGQSVGALNDLISGPEPGPEELYKHVVNQTTTYGDYKYQESISGRLTVEGAQRTKNFLDHLEGAVGDESNLHHVLKAADKALAVFPIASEAFNFIGEVAGWWDEDEPYVPSQPTLTQIMTSGTINGTMRTNAKTHLSFNVLVPGTYDKSDQRPNSTIYNCPLGVVSLRNKPVLLRKDYWQYYGGEDTYYENGVRLSTFGTRFQKFVKYMSLKTKSNYQPQIDINGSTGMDLVSVEAAYVLEIPSDISNALYTHNHVYNLSEDEYLHPDYSHVIQPSYYEKSEVGYQNAYYHNLVQTHVYYNWLTEEIDKGNYLISGYTDDMLTLMTPYTQPECMKDMALSLPRIGQTESGVLESNVKLRLKCVLQIPGTEKKVVFVKDYEVDYEYTNSTDNTNWLTNQSNMGSYRSRPVLGYLPPFSNYSSDFNVMIPFDQHANDAFNSVVGGVNTFKSASAYQISDRSYDNDQFLYTSAKSITVAPNTTVLPGTEWEAKIEEYDFTITCHSVPNEPIIGQFASCDPSLSDYDPNNEYYWKKGVVVEDESVALSEVYPNPTEGFLYIGENVSADLFDLSGKLKITFSGEPMIDISNQEPGVYILQINNSEGTTSERITLH